MDIRSVLLVDDNEIDHFLNEQIIRRYDPNIAVSKAYDGQEALDALAQMEEGPDVIFLDINMPGMDGFGFLAEHEKNSNSNTSVVVMLSSSSNELDKDKASKFRCVVSYTVKPLSVDDLGSLSRL